MVEIIDFPGRQGPTCDWCWDVVPVPWTQVTDTATGEVIVPYACNEDHAEKALEDELTERANVRRREKESTR